MLEIESNVFLADPREDLDLLAKSTVEIYFFNSSAYSKWIEKWSDKISEKMLGKPDPERPLAELNLKLSHPSNSDSPEILWKSRLDQACEFKKIQDSKLQGSQIYIHPTAEVHSSAVIEGRVNEGVRIGANCFVGARSEIKKGSTLDPGVQVYQDVIIGTGCHLESGCIIGSPGFGFDSSGQRIPHISGVELSEDVQIGANSVVSAGCLQPTRIGARSTLDSLVQIGHHAQIGSDVKMASQSGVGGSTHIGNGTLIAGGAQISDGLNIGSQVRIAAKAGVISDVQDGQTVGGFPHLPIRTWHRINHWLKSQV